MKTILSGLCALLLAVGTAFATTWGESKVKDPVSGKSIKVHEPMSSGSYIYEWPGRWGPTTSTGSAPRARR